MEKPISDDLGREISRLWEKVGPAAAATEPGPPPVSLASFNDAAWEAVDLLKSRHQRQERRWAELLEARELALSALQERQALLEKELHGLRERAAGADERALADALDGSLRVQEVQEALAGERAARSAQRLEMQGLVDAAREAAAAEGARWRDEARHWEKAEQKCRLDLQQAQALAERREAEAQHAEEAVQRLSRSVQNSQAALEGALAEVARERRERQDGEAERARVTQSAAALEKRIAELAGIWEQRLEREREAWRAEMAAQEQVRAGQARRGVWPSLCNFLTRWK